MSMNAGPALRVQRQLPGQVVHAASRIATQGCIDRGSAIHELNPNPNPVHIPKQVVHASRMPTGIISLASATNARYVRVYS